MNRLLYTTTIMLLLGSASSLASFITSEGDGTAGIDFIINQDDDTIDILRGAGNDYQFYAETSQGSGIPDDITLIKIDSGATGDFTILIDHPDPTIAGADDLIAAELEHPNGPTDTCTV